MVRAVTQADGSADGRCAVPEHWSPLLLPQLPRTPLLRTPLRRLTPSSVHARQSIAACIAPVHCRFLSGTPRIVLADLNANALHKAARRIRRYRPTSYQLNVLAPFTLPEQAFDSISMNYLLHCLPGTISEKAIAFDHLLPLLNPGGVVFGSTILRVGVELGSLARAFLDFYNRTGVINNAGDTLADLEACLRSRLTGRDPGRGQRRSVQRQRWLSPRPVIHPTPYCWSDPSPEPGRDLIQRQPRIHPEA